MHHASWLSGSRGASCDGVDQARSKRSRFITLAHAATKSRTNFSFESSHAYTSARARSCDLEPKTRSTAVAVRLTLPVAGSRPSYTFSAAADARHSALMSTSVTKKSLVNVGGPSVKTQCADWP